MQFKSLPDKETVGSLRATDKAKATGKTRQSKSAARRAATSRSRTSRSRSRQASRARPDANSNRAQGRQSDLSGRSGAARQSVAQAIKPATAEKPAPVSRPRPIPAGMAKWVETYCKANRQSIAAMQLVWQRQQLEKAEKSLDKKIAALDAKITAYRTLLDNDKKMRGKINRKVVGIFAVMRPDAAATQLAAMAEGKALVVLASMEPKQASQILNEMSPPKAARLAEMMLSENKKAKE
ncbi:MAG: hypothetical protein KDJ29_04345 [Hyphomicrobiales bacterium]|nr:hypothetical protein [Hyphomicrobiales bacterium]